MLTENKEVTVRTTADLNMDDYLFSFKIQCFSGVFMVKQGPLKIVVKRELAKPDSQFSIYLVQ